MPDSRIRSKLEQQGVDPRENAKMEKSVRGLEQAPTVVEQTPDQNTWQQMRDQLGPPFDNERITLRQCRQLRKDPMIAFGLHYIKVPLVVAPWHINAVDKDGPNAQIAAFVDAALRPVYARLMLQRLLAMDFGFSAMTKRFEEANPGGVYLDPREENPENQVKAIWDEGSILPIVWKAPVALKPERVQPVFDDRTGEFNGMTYDVPPVRGSRTRRRKAKGQREIDIYHSYWGTNQKDEEHGSIYGYPRTGYARLYWWLYQWLFHLSNRAYERLAIPPILARHPEGSTVVDEETGATQMNWEIALEMAERLRSNSVAAVPSKMAETGLDSTSNTQREWDFEYMDTPTQALEVFDARFNYANVMKLRSVFVPEQAFIEGEGGTSSRNVAAQMAEVFQDSQQITKSEIDDELNRYWIPQILALNFQEFLNNGGRATIVSHGFRSQDIEFQKQIIQLIGQADAASLSAIDIDEMFRRLQLPMKDPVALASDRARLAQQVANSSPPLVEPGPGSVGVVANPNVNPGATNGGSVPQPNIAAALGFSETIYVQPNDFINLDFADVTEFLSGLPGSKHYRDKTIRALAVQLRRMWSGFYRRLYPEFAAHVSRLSKIEFSDEDVALVMRPDTSMMFADSNGRSGGIRVAVTKKRAQKAAKRIIDSWQVSSKIIEDMMSRSATIIRKMVERAAKLDLREVDLTAEIEQQTIETFLEEQVGRLIRLTNETTKDQLREFLVSDIRDGKTPQEIADRIVVHFEGISSSRADRIARSETRDAVNAATLISSEAAGIKYVRAIDGERFDDECRKRNNKLFTVKEAWKEMRKEHPYGTLGFDPIPRANFSIQHVMRMPDDAPEDALAFFDGDDDTVYIHMYADGNDVDEYLANLSDVLIAGGTS